MIGDWRIASRLASDTNCFYRPPFLARRAWGKEQAFLKMQRPFDLLLRDIARLGLELPTDEGNRILALCREREFPKRAKIFESAHISDAWALITSGFAASYYLHQDGRTTLTRFFQAGNIAGNVNSTWSRDYGSDELIAVSDVTFVEFPHEFLLKEFTHGEVFGQYLRAKVIETLRYDKDLLVCQSLSEPSSRLDFLRNQHPDILSIALKKDIAAFLGVTPQGYSRILRREKESKVSPDC